MILKSQTYKIKPHQDPRTCVKFNAGGKQNKISLCT